MRTQANSSSSLQSRSGIGTIVIVIILVIIVVVAGVAAYSLIVVQSTTSTSTGQSSSQTSTATSSSASTTTTRTTLSISSTTTTALSGVKTYSATFNYTQPLGPVGELVYSNNTVKTFTSVQVASGSFTFSINPSTYTGSGSGQGTLTVTTSGFCSGHTTVPYTFQIPDATTILGGNITVFIGTPTPANFTVPLTCTATPASASTNTFPFLSTYPNEISVRSVPIIISQHLAGNINYYFNIKPTN